MTNVFKLKHEPTTLPDELWVEIFHHATFVDGTSGPSIYAYAERYGLHNRGNSPHELALRRSLTETRRHLPLVSRRWHRLATSYLYSSIWVNDVNVLPSLAATVSEPRPKGAHGLDAALGSYTKRLDVVLKDYTAEIDPSTCTQDFPNLADIIRSLPRLAVLVFASEMSDHSYLPEDILEAICSHRGIRALEWRTRALNPSPSQIITLLSSGSLLCPRILSCKHAALPSIHDGSTPPAAMQSLEFLSLDSLGWLSELTCDSFPHLRYLTIKESACTQIMVMFLESLGRPLTSVHYVVEPGQIADPFLLPTIARHCPNLTRFTFSIPANVFFDAGQFPLPSGTMRLPPVKRLAFMLYNGSEKDKAAPTCNHIWNLLKALTTRFPSIRVIEFLNIHIRYKSLLATAPSRLSGITFEYEFIDE
ncbi:hypothetical protein CONPUDRAFT_70385 [Coniophora puteana RWD-64-598 SS2]|uniref:F-box domain-containing protein n=1 Tax=Coniophora puteana (strain RWD-64-598) TaxID=741705 RepID=A0A5M3N3N5_CONPW|nr:uncharacterized protein CONPUDRAFT_70385 [Coniophora puteana RWD-64-598 SS2]EIW85624.1 hypothetical protein CONPUDRAFT_70385 [Coniophora puteana RWD-64-598 SS2]